MPLATRLATKHTLAINDVGQKCPAGSYSSLQTPLGAPPKGMEWHQDPSTHEWSIVATTTDAAAAAGNPSEGMPLVVDGMIEHVRTPEDTVQGICLRYGITDRQLRQANGGFSGPHLILAPSVLRIPMSTTTTISQGPVLTEQQTKEAQVREIRRKVPSLSVKEAKCYLDMNDGDVKLAIENAKEDAEFEAIQH